MFKTTEAEWKINKSTCHMQINLSLCRTSDHYFSLSLQRLSWDSLGTKNVSSTHAQNFWKVIKCRQKRCGRNHIVYSPEIIQTSSLVRLQKKSLEHNDCLHVACLSPWRVRKFPTDNILSLQNYFQTNLFFNRCFGSIAT